ncbi:RNA 3'-terminal phosphate cyclase [Natronobacterium gregoryi]|uniref:RNA 3'-terminal phosphate cyclase n=2 Tax=Natronobacterium gregoryi TaxID=44930 RepID=L0AK92_NATGS|nr:RNA 3'-terminal phosphate cyclase [Natronobacterium gregoryi]AFZ73874.1 RNA 3'-phosphate cyclase [Natronobacterium gregoryi SP2]ELY65034.1 RNA 3'-terminal-phosphate cyclase [Natronobacterium gregoryi SP2]PLK18411.1 RNA 3'-terminal phosphate cyclase [Natronobacterium gregoryi SP2]SFJ71185.1 RNA 3'-terminal phosphate cyclase (ATP) [Natronobacterium gregoryi]
MTPTYELDGSEAGGQFVRTALALSVLENEPIRIENVRGDRPDPGLAHQHLAVLETMVELCDADATGVELGAETIEFDPGLDNGLEGGQYAVDIGTAGSVTLLFDAVLPLATVLESPLELTVTGGTDVKWSPPLDYFRHVKLPLLRGFGLDATCEPERRGFYPDGGGEVTLHLEPSAIDPIELEARGDLETVRLYSTESESLADRDVAHRQAEGGVERLEWDGDLERRETTADSPSSGSVLVIRVEHALEGSKRTGIAGFSSLGERGKPAERVGEDAADAANRFREGTAPVDRHMADQLLVYLAIAGGRVRIPAVTDHVESSLELLGEMGVEATLERDVSNAETAVVAVELESTIR